MTKTMPTRGGMRGSICIALGPLILGLLQESAEICAYLEEQDPSFRDPTRFLVGDTFTLADLTMASMLSPLARPPEHPFDPRMAYGKAGNAWVEGMRGYRMLDWVRGCYALHRAR